MESMLSILRPVLQFIVVLLGAWMVMRLRSGTTHSLSQRFWVLCTRSVVCDPVQRQFMQEASDLEAFKFVYGIEAGSRANLHRLIAWLAQHSIEPRLARKAGRWIDPRQETILTSPSQKHRRNLVLITLLLALPLAFCSSKIADAPALLTMKQSSVSFFTDGKTVRSLTGRWVFDLETCSTANQQLLATSSGFKLFEAAATCSAFRDGTLQHVVESALKEQHWLGVSLSVALLIVLGVFLRRVVELDALRQVQRRIDCTRPMSHVDDVSRQRDYVPSIETEVLGDGTGNAAGVDQTDRALAR
jgi:hypothetical protein